ncbi:unnamed protein product, partial [Adineta steineri]
STVVPGKTINQQPRAIDNCFGLAPKERLIATYTKQPGGCGCGPTFTTHLTDSRIIQRQQEYACCGEGNRVDKMLFLSDISFISDTVVKQDCYSSICCRCLCCFLSCCRGTGGKQVGIRGAFGEEIFTFTFNDAARALQEIPAAAMPHKGAGHQLKTAAETNTLF